MISRQKLIEELTDVIVKHTCKPSGCEDCLCAFEYGTVEESCEEYLEYNKLAEKIYSGFVVKIIDRKPPADQWIPCSSGILPKHKQNVFITIELLKGIRYCTTVTYYTEMGIVDEYEWTGEGFYSYDSEYGYGKYEKVIAWMPAEPYMGAE